MDTANGTESDPQDDVIYRPDQIAFEVWLWKAHRSNKETAMQLKELEIPDANGNEITTALVNRWSKTYAWASRGNALIRDLAPSIHNETVGGLIIAGLKSQRALDRMLEEYLDKRIVPAKEAISMIDVAFKYAGFSPIGMANPTGTMRTRGGGISHVVSARYLTEEELAEFESEATDPRQIPVRVTDDE